MSSTEKIYCPSVTFSGNLLESAEFCETEVDEYGDMCERHDEEDRAAAAYEAWQEDARYDD